MYVPKSRFSTKKGVHCSGALLKKPRTLFGYISLMVTQNIKISTDSTFRYSKLFTIFELKNRSTLLKTRKKIKFLYLCNRWRKKIHAKTFYFFLIRGVPFGAGRYWSGHSVICLLKMRYLQKFVLLDDRWRMKTFFNS